MRVDRLSEKEKIKLFEQPLVVGGETAGILRLTRDSLPEERATSIIARNCTNFFVTPRKVTEVIRLLSEVEFTDSEKYAIVLKMTPRLHSPETSDQEILNAFKLAKKAIPEKAHALIVAKIASFRTQAVESQDLEKEDRSVFPTRRDLDCRRRS